MLNIREEIIFIKPINKQYHAFSFKRKTTKHLAEIASKNKIILNNRIQLYGTSIKLIIEVVETLISIKDNKPEVINKKDKEVLITFSFENNFEL